MVTKFEPDNWLLLVADDWPSLRRCDLFRLFDELDERHWCAFESRLEAMRPDLYRKAREEQRDCLELRRHLPKLVGFGKQSLNQKNFFGYGELNLED